MTAIAAARAKARGLANVTTRVLDLEQIDEPDESFDVVLCREGLMLVPDPARAAREIRRVLRPGGRLAVAVWGPRAQPMARRHVRRRQRPARLPGAADECPRPVLARGRRQVRRRAHRRPASDVGVSEFPVPLHARSFEEWWTARCALAGPLTKILASMPDDAVQAIRDRAHEAARAYETPRGLEFPGVALLASGRRV